MNTIIVDINPKHIYLITLFGNLYADGKGLCDPADDFLRNIGRCEEYDADVSRDDAADESSEEYSESSSDSVSYLCFSTSYSRDWEYLEWEGRFLTLNGAWDSRGPIPGRFLWNVVTIQSWFSGNKLICCVYLTRLPLTFTKKKKTREFNKLL
jgi:hypothetical protein